MGIFKAYDIRGIYGQGIAGPGPDGVSCFLR